MGNVIKKRRKKMSKHKYRKMLKKTRWQRRHPEGRFANRPYRVY